MATTPTKLDPQGANLTTMVLNSSQDDHTYGISGVIIKQGLFTESKTLLISSIPERNETAEKQNCRSWNDKTQG